MHVFSNNHNDKKITIAVNELVGKPYSFIQRLRKNGVGSRRILLESYSPGLHQYFDQDNDLKKVNLELRPNGIIVFIKNKVNDYKWVIPFHALQIFKTEALSLHAHGNFLKFKHKNVFPLDQKFFDKVIDSRNEYYGSRDFIDQM